MEGREIADVEGEGPRGFGPGDFPGGGLPGPHVGHAHVAFFEHHEFCAGEGANGAVSGAIAVEFPFEAGEAAGGGIDGGDGVDFVLLGVDLEGEVVEEEIEVLLGAGDLFLEVIDVFFAEAGGVAGEVGKFIDDLSEHGEFSALGSAHGPDVDFGRAVAAEDGAVVDEGDLEALASAGDGGSEAGVSASDDDEVIAVLGGRICGEVELGAAEVEEGLVVVGRGEVGVLGEEEGVAASVEAFEVLEGDGGFGVGDFDRAAFLPVPLGAFVSEGVDGFAIDEDFELAGGAGGVPLGDPVLGADVEVVGAGRGEGDFGGGIGDGGAHAVGDEVGRAHIEDELGVGGPSAAVIEGFGFEEDGIGILRGKGESGGEEDWSESGDHRLRRECCNGGENADNSKGLSEEFLCDKFEMVEDFTTYELGAINIWEKSVRGKRDW